MKGNLNNICFNKQSNSFNFSSKDDQNSEKINLIDSLNKKIPPFN